MLELSPELVTLLSGVIGFLVAEGLQSLSRLIGRDLSGMATAFTAAIVSLLVASVNGLLASIPAEYIPVARGILLFLVAVLVPAGVHSILKREKK